MENLKKNAEGMERSTEDKSATQFINRWNSEYEAIKDIPMYQRNKTMIMLGKQSFSIEGQLLEDYENVKAAHRDFIPYPGVYDLARNMLSLGIIYGKREERQRRKKDECKSIENTGYIKKINEVIETVQDEWVLEQIYRCVVNITKGSCEDGRK